MSSLPYSGLSLEPDGNVYGEVMHRRLGFIGPMKITVEGENEEGHPVRLVVYSAANHARSGIGIAEVHDEPEIRVSDLTIIRTVQVHHRLVIDAALNPREDNDATYRLFVDPPKTRIAKRDKNGRPKAVHDLTHKARIERIVAQKVRPCTALFHGGYEPFIQPDDTYFKVTDYSQRPSYIAGRAKYPERVYHPGCQPMNLAAAIDILMEP